MRTTKNLAAIARDRGCNMSRASRPRIAGKMPATQESSSDWRRHTQLPCEESRGGAWVSVQSLGHGKSRGRHARNGRARGVYRLAASGLNVNKAFACRAGCCERACNAPPCWWPQGVTLPTRSVGIGISSSRLQDFVKSLLLQVGAQLWLHAYWGPVAFPACV